jgi:hypothetical protein
MERRSSSGLAGPAVIIALLAALGLRPAMSRSIAPASAPSPVAGAGLVASPTRASDGYAENGGYEHGAGYLLDRFFDRLSDDLENKKPWTTSQRKSDLGPTRDFESDDTRSAYAAECLIVTFPSPISPPLRYFFDSSLAALQSAAETAGYSLDSYDLPWTGSTKDSSGKFQLGGEVDVFPTSKSEAKGDSSYLYALKPNSDSDDRWKRDCGIILFRDRTQPRLLIVFVVGETPTSGVNKAALRDALDQVTWLNGWQTSEHQPAQHLVTMFQKAANASVIRIVGPTFSGSAASLRNALDDWRHYSTLKVPTPGDPLSVNIVSGTATAISSETLTLAAGPKNLRPVVFKSVQIPDSVLSKAIPLLLYDISMVPAPENSETGPTLGSEAPRIAYLNENTAYGNPHGDGRTSEDKDHNLTMPYPLHISQLRATSKADSTSNP